MPSEKLKIEILFRQHYKVLRAYAFRLVNDPDAAEDIVQDVFLGVWDNRHSLDCASGARMKSYLFRAVYNRALNYLASLSVAGRDPIELIIDRVQAGESDTPLPQQLYMARELHEEIRRFAASLPPQARRVFELSRMRGMKAAEVAGAMGLSVKTVEKYLYKALSDLRVRLRVLGFIEFVLLFYMF